MDAFKVAHIATEIAVIGAIYVVLKRKVDHERAERELLAAKVQKLEEVSKQHMEALKILYAKIEELEKRESQEPKSFKKNMGKSFDPLKKLYSEEEPKKTKGAGVFATDSEQYSEEETVPGYQPLEDEDEYERPEHVIGSSSLDETD